MPPSVDVLVVGAGIAGLVAACELRRCGYSVVVLEARDRVGGRVVNEELCPGVPIEMGGQWVGPGQDKVLGLIDELGLSTFPTYVKGRHILETRRGRKLYTGRVPLLSPITLADAGLAMAALWRASRKISPEAPWDARDAEHLDGQTLASWMDRNIRTGHARALLRLITRAVFAAEPEDMSALWAMSYIRAAGGMNSVVSIDGGAQQDRVVGGTQRIALRLAEQLDERLILEHPVTAIDWDSHGVSARSGHDTYTATRGIIAIPPMLTGRIRFNPPLPSDRDQLVQRMPMGRVIKVNIAYGTPFWRDQGLSGQVTSDWRAVSAVLDNSPASGTPGVLVGFLEGRHADIAARLPADRRRRLVLDDLASYFGPDASEPLAYLERDWAAEEYTRGCYGAFASPGALTRFGPALRAPIGPIHWAGTETATRWTGYIDGAIESGQRAAKEVLQTLDSEPVAAGIEQA